MVNGRFDDSPDTTCLGLASPSSKGWKGLNGAGIDSSPGVFGIGDKI